MRRLRSPSPELLSQFHKHRLWLESSWCTGSRFGSNDVCIFDLQGLNLDGLELSLGSFDYADFTGSSLRGAWFIGAELDSATFRDCDLSGARFDHANLTLASFIGATLEQASFKNAVANYTKWDEADLAKIGAAFRKACATHQRNTAKLKEGFTYEEWLARVNQRHVREERHQAALCHENFEFWRELKTNERYSRQPSLAC